MCRSWHNACLMFFRKVKTKQSMKRILIISALLLLAVAIPHAKAQQWALKSNLLYDATATINLGAEVAFAPQWSVDLSANFNGWEVINNRSWKHYLVQPEVRYWLCEAFSGHFFGLHLHGGQYDMANLNNNIDFLGTDFSLLSDSRFKGWFLGVGVGYGYAFALGKHWNLELELGVGYAFTRYDRFALQGEKSRIAHNYPHNYFGLTKLEVGIVYLF